MAFGSVAELRKPLGDVASGEMRDPPCGVREQADRREPGLRPHVEPVGRMGGHADEITALAKHGEYLVAHVQVEHSGALDEEAHFVFVVRMFVEELRTK